MVKMLIFQHTKTHKKCCSLLQSHFHACMQVCTHTCMLCTERLSHFAMTVTNFTEYSAHSSCRLHTSFDGFSKWKFDTPVKKVQNVLNSLSMMFGNLSLNILGIHLTKFIQKFICTNIIFIFALIFNYTRIITAIRFIKT
jgi:hypothetical protein